jgi:hypothetical protein
MSPSRGIPEITGRDVLVAKKSLGGLKIKPVYEKANQIPGENVAK